MITIKSNLKDFDRILKKYPQEIRSAQSIALSRMGQEMRSTAMSLSPIKTGDLRGSILMSPIVPKNTVTVGTNKVYARIHDFGGTIRPKNGTYLTIPIGGTRGSIRDHTGFFIRAKSGSLYFVKYMGNGVIKPLYVLRRSVTIKAKPYLSKAFKIMTSGKGQKILGEEIDYVIKSLR